MARGIFVERGPRDLVPRAPRQDAIFSDLAGLFSLNESQTGLLPTARPNASERSPLGLQDTIRTLIENPLNTHRMLPAALYAF
jgi:hypothetical protein